MQTFEEENRGLRLKESIVEQAVLAAGAEKTSSETNAPRQGGRLLENIAHRRLIPRAGRTTESNGTRISAVDVSAAATPSSLSSKTAAVRSYVGHSTRMRAIVVGNLFDERGYVAGGTLRPGEDAYAKNKFNQAASDRLASNRHIPDTRVSQ